MLELSVFIAQSFAGYLTQADTGLHTFRYDPHYSGPPLSLSMPVSNQVYAARVVDAYLLGLLPDDERVRREAGRRFGVSGNNPVALLSHMGLDCPGAVQFCPRGQEESIMRPEILIPLTDEGVSTRLRPPTQRQEDTWLRSGEHWSLGGNQSKFALRYENGTWYECQGAAATTHILKPGIEGMRLEALDEYMTMRMAHAVGIPAAQVSYREFCGVPAIIVKRYDRILTETGVARIHQEDLCQALSITPDKKYAEDGGPSTPDILRALDQTDDVAVSRSTFAAMLFFNYLMAAPDAHAKNYSLMHIGNTCRLAPLYDVASGFPYYHKDASVPRMAMSIGGENRIGLLCREHLLKFAEMADLGADVCLNLMANLAKRLIDRSPQVTDEVVAEGIEGAQELSERLLPRIDYHCHRMLQVL